MKWSLSSLNPTFCHSQNIYFPLQFVYCRHTLDDMYNFEMIKLENQISSILRFHSWILHNQLTVSWCAGLLLREIKDFWRPSLVLSLLLYPQDIVSSKDSSSEDAELNERRSLFDRVEKAILEMGNGIICFQQKSKASILSSPYIIKFALPYSILLIHVWIFENRNDSELFVSGCRVGESLGTETTSGWQRHHGYTEDKIRRAYCERMGNSCLLLCCLTAC